MANSSFALGMVASIADKLKAMKTERDAVITAPGVISWSSRHQSLMRTPEARFEAADGAPRKRGWCRRRLTKPAGPRARRWRSISGLELHQRDGTSCLWGSELIR